MSKLIKITANCIYVALVTSLIGCRDIQKTEVFVMPDLTYMSPAVKPNEHVKVSVFSEIQQIHDVERLDLIVFQRDEFPKGTHVLRVVGLPSERLALTHMGLYINGERFHFPDKLLYLDAAISKASKTKGNRSYQTNPESFFLLGDNLEKALDSRILGGIRYEEFYGKVVEGQPHPDSTSQPVSEPDAN